MVNKSRNRRGTASAAMRTGVQGKDTRINHGELSTMTEPTHFYLVEFA